MRLTLIWKVKVILKVRTERLAISLVQSGRESILSSSVSDNSEEGDVDVKK